MRSYDDLVYRYSKFKKDELESFSIELMDLIKGSLDENQCIDEIDISEYKSIRIEKKKDEKVKELVYIILNINKLNYKNISNILNKIEAVQRRKSISYTCSIVALGGYEDYGDIKPSMYQMFGFKLCDMSWFKGLFEDDEIKVDLVGHNQYAYEKIKEDLKTNDKTSAIQPTGSGKSYLAARCILDYKDKNVVVLSSTREIIKQFKRNFTWMCSDNINMMTYSKLMKMGEEEFNSLLNSDISLYLLDEYHRCGAKRWGERVKDIMSYVREENTRFGISEGNSKTKFIGLTATPVRDLDKERNMTKELFGGNIASEMTLSEAILRKILPMPKYVIVFHELDGDIKRIEDKISKSKRNNREKAILRRKLNSIIRKWTESNDVAHILKKYITNERKFIVFCEDTSHIGEIKRKSVEWFKNAFGEDTNIHTYKVLYKYGQSNSELKKFLNSKEPGFHLLFNIEKLTEGMHASGISGVILVRKTQSRIKHLQMQGRCLQTDSEHQPLILDLVNNIGNVKGLSFEDDIRESVTRENKLRQEYGLNNITDEEIEEEYIHYIYDEVQDVVEMFSKLEGRINVTWDEYYEKLEDYYNENGTYKVPSNCGDISFYRWTIEQRRARKEGKLSQDQIDKLDRLGYDWTFRERIFDSMYEELEEFFNEYGHCRVREDYENRNLYNFVVGRRYMYSKGILSKEEIEKLEKINFIWNVNEDEWMQGYRNMVSFYKKHNHSNPTKSNASSELVAWKDRVRKLYKEGKLSDERKALMDNLDFQYDIMGDRWEDNISELEKYKKEYGNLDIKRNNPKYRSLATWLSDMKKLKKKGKLSKDREKRLTELGIVWDVHESKWDESLIDLIEYKKVYKTFKVDRKINITLYRWVKKQINDFKIGKLSERRESKLSEIGFFEEVL